MSEQEVLKYLMDIFPAPGTVEGQPLIEMKFKMQFGPDEEKIEELHTVIEKLKDKGILNEFEFNNTINYKAKEDIPIALGGSGAAPPVSGDKLGKLTDLVLALAAKHDDPEIAELAKKLQ